MKIAILGASPSKDDAPFSDPSWQIWTCSPGTVCVPRVDFHFELHTLAEIGRACDESYIEYLGELPCYMQDQYAQFPQSIKFPRDDMLATFGPHFMTSSIAWMMALAITRRPDVIGLWGVDMAALEEYENQRPGCFRFIELAKDRGIDVFIPEKSGLMRTPKLYGYDD